MSACVLGLVVWKARRRAPHARWRRAKSTSETSHIRCTNMPRIRFQAVDVAMSGMVDLLKYQSPQRRSLQHSSWPTRRMSLPQLREIGVLDTLGELALFVAAGDADAQQFRSRLFHLSSRTHRSNICASTIAIASRLTGRMTIILSQADQRPGRQLQRRADGRHRQRVLQRLLQDISISASSAGISLMRSRRHRADALAIDGCRQGSVRNAAVPEQAEAKSGTASTRSRRRSTASTKYFGYEQSYAVSA